MSITSVDQTLGNQVKTANKKGQVAMDEDGNRRSRNEWGSPAKTVKKKKKKKRKEFFSRLQPWEALLF